MEFRNLTPFATLQYSMKDVAKQAYHVVVMKIGYRLIPDSDGQCRLELIYQPEIPLCFQDEYKGAVNLSSVIQESDLSPFKPRCDVIVNGVGYAPGGIAVPNFSVSIHLQNAQGETLCEKTLRVTGPRHYVAPSNGESIWRLSEPEPIVTLPLDYAYAFGGECRISAAEDDTNPQRVPATYRLSEEVRLSHPDGAEVAPIAHTVYEYNPLGLGFVEPWYLTATKKVTIPAPQIVFEDADWTADTVQDLITGQWSSDSRAYQPAGLGLIGRAWLPRRDLAGTYDDSWVKERHPHLPEDFDFGYWNGAPADQQIAFPPLDCRFTLTNLTRHGHLDGQLPGHRPFVLLRMDDGRLLPRPMLLDTFILDSEELMLCLTYRYVVSQLEAIRVIEARFEIDPKAPIIRFAPRAKSSHSPTSLPESEQLSPDLNASR